MIFHAKFLGQILHFSSKTAFHAKFQSQILHFSSKTAFHAKFQSQILHFASKTAFPAKLADTRHKENGGVRKYINICYLLSPFRQPHAHSAASYQTFSKAEQTPPLFRIELFSVNRPCKLHILYHTFDIICAYRISLCNLCFSIFIFLNNFFN